MKDLLLVAGLLAAPAAVSVQQYKPTAPVKQRDPRLSLLEKFFGDRSSPLRDSARDFLIAADQNHLDWRLLPSISIIESSGGKASSGNNVFGWGSAKAKFPSVRAGIHYVAAQLGRSKTYKGKNLDGKLQTYNPVPFYPQRVKAVMRAISTYSQPRFATAD